jgi:aminocarboxymuconate-semialdehyde decarboxylase
MNSNRMKMEQIDVHAHLYPTKYLQMVADHADKMWLRGQRFPAIEKMYNLEMRLKEMDYANVTRQVLSIGPPGVDGLDKDRAINEAKTLNDELARVVRMHPKRFAAVAVLPLQSIDAALDELDRAVNELGFKGAMINSNVSKKPLDSTYLFPLYNRAGRIGIPLHIHPHVPVCTKFQTDYGLYVTFGFLVDSSLAVLRLILSGVLDKFPKTKFVISHLGGLLPYVKQRIDDQWLSFPPSLRGEIKLPPSNYLERFYVDTVNNYPPSYGLAKKIFGIQQILFGTDYPFLSSKACVDCVTNLEEFSYEEKLEILSGNARRIYKL